MTAKVVNESSSAQEFKKTIDDQKKELGNLNSQLSEQKTAMEE